jgi:hypothetical protein
LAAELFFSTAAMSSLVFNTNFVVLLFHYLLHVGPAFGRACNSLPRCFAGLDPDRFVGGCGLELWLWRRSYTHHRLYEDLLRRRTEKKEDLEGRMRFGNTAQSAITAFWASKLDNKKPLNLNL